MRKTIDVAYILERGNYFLANSEPEQKGERKGVASMIELALHEAGAYKGFRQLGLGALHEYAERTFPDHIQRARFVAQSLSEGEWRLGDKRFELDDTRREYYTHSALKSDRRKIRMES